MDTLLSRWRLWMVAGAVCMAIGQRVHPEFDYAPPTFDLILASPMRSALWIPAHAVILAGLILLTLGLAGLACNGLLSGAAALAGRLAVVGAALTSVEMAFHLLAAFEVQALVAGGPTPIISTHHALQVIGHPILGFAVATLAVLEIRQLGATRLGWAWAAMSLIGLVGAVAHGLAGPLVLLGQNAALGPLFSGAAPMAAYLAVLALLAPRLARSAGPAPAAQRTSQRRATLSSTLP